MQHHQRDYSTDQRLLFLCLIAALIGGFSTVAAGVLLNLVRFFTNLFFSRPFPCWNAPRLSISWAAG